ncbi:protein TESPA1 [Phyllobates terribilis]|uniref:protein TESPA1 n=1 Tax=Phyllobates terribilis TaxID=111132 RepID=UPI003CCB41B4
MKMSVLSSARHVAWSRSLHVNDSMEVGDSIAIIRSMSEFTFQDVDDAFLEEGCTTEMIQNWIKNCSLCPENFSEVIPLNKAPYSKGNSLDDDFTLGAEATLLTNHQKNSIRS